MFLVLYIHTYPTLEKDNIMKKLTSFVGLLLFFFIIYVGIVIYMPNVFNGFFAEMNRFFNIAVNFIQPYLF